MRWFYDTCMYHVSMDRRLKKNHDIIIKGEKYGKYIKQCK